MVKRSPNFYIRGRGKQACTVQVIAMSTIRANEIELYYEDHGSDEPLLLISGFACDHAIWGKVEPSLSKRYRVITFDNRGGGQSSAPDCAYSIKQMADDAAALLDAISVGQAHVVGHSMGGMI